MSFSLNPLTRQTQSQESGGNLEQHTNICHLPKSPHPGWGAYSFSVETSGWKFNIFLSHWKCGETGNIPRRTIGYQRPHRPHPVVHRHESGSNRLHKRCCRGNGTEQRALLTVSQSGWSATLPCLNLNIIWRSVSWQQRWECAMRPLIYVCTNNDDSHGFHVLHICFLKG